MFSTNRWRRGSLGRDILRAAMRSSCRVFPPCACPAGGSEQAGRPRSRQVARRLAIRVAAGQRELLSLRQASQPIAPYGVNDLRSPVSVPLVVFCVVSGHDIRRENVQSPTDSTPTLWPPFGHRIVEKRQSGAGIVQHEMWVQGSARVLAAVLLSRPVFGRVDRLASLNGAIAGLVAITAGPDIVSQGWAVVIGAVGGAVCLFGMKLLERLKIDDEVGAIPAHMGAGVWGTLAVCIAAGVTPSSSSPASSRSASPCSAPRSSSGGSSTRRSGPGSRRGSSGSARTRPSSASSRSPSSASWSRTDIEQGRRCKALPARWDARHPGLVERSARRLRPFAASRAFRNRADPQMSDCTDFSREKPARLGLLPTRRSVHDCVVNRPSKGSRACIPATSRSASFGHIAPFAKAAVLASTARRTTPTCSRSSRSLRRARSHSTISTLRRSRRAAAKPIAVEIGKVAGGEFTASVMAAIQ